MFSYPILILVYQFIVEKKTFNQVEYIALVMALIGVVLAVDVFDTAVYQLNRLGLILAFVSAITYAFMNIFGERLINEMPSQLITAYTSTISTIGLCLIIPYDTFIGKSFSIEQWLYIMAAAILSTVLPMNFMYWGIKKIGAFYAAIVSVSELPCILILAYIVLHERISYWQLAGGILIIVSVVLLQLKIIKNNKAVNIN
jgi:drug/metabolite transporter (DMT)-like permease